MHINLMQFIDLHKKKVFTTQQFHSKAIAKITHYTLQNIVFCLIIINFTAHPSAENKLNAYRK